MEDITILKGNDSEFFDYSVMNAIGDLKLRSSLSYRLKSFTESKGKIEVDFILEEKGSDSMLFNGIAITVYELFQASKLIGICYHANKKTIHLELSFYC
jgi:hypothetical protein